MNRAGSIHRLFLAAAIALLSGCAVKDADLESPAATKLDLAPAAASVNVFQVAVSGTATFSYTSSEPATLELIVEGATVAEQTLVVDALTKPIQATLPLAREGSNAITAILRYNGQEITQRMNVNVALSVPTIQVGAFQTSYVASTSMTASTSVQVGTDASYSIDGVFWALDGGPWFPALAGTGGNFGISILNPDIGRSDVAIRVDTSVDAHATSTIVHAPLDVSPVFDCATPAASMLPNTTLIQNFRNEQRMMVGYFGDPNAGHQVSFVLHGNVQMNATTVNVTEVSQTITYGRLDLEASFPTDIYQCNNAPCDVSYDLEAWVDGKMLCSKTAFGNIHNY